MLCGYYRPTKVKPMYYLYAFQSNIDHNNINLQSLLRREKIQKATYKVLVDLMNTNAELDTVK